jgi:hypothetical protein
MEDVLEVYCRPYDEKRPVIRMDGQPVWTFGGEAEPVNGHYSRREDNGYIRKGTCSVFMFVEAPGGRRYVSASRQGTKKDRAREVKAVVREEYPQAEKVVLVMDNLNTRTISSFCVIARSGATK